MAAALALGTIPALGSALAAIGAAIAPFILPVLAVVAVVLVVVVVVKYWDNITSFFKKAYDKGKALVGAAATAIGGAIDNTIEGTQLLFKKIAIASIAVYTATTTAIRENLNPKYTVYALYDADGNVEYIGRTKNPVAREQAHGNDPKRKHLTFTTIASGLTYEQARGYEQIMMLHCHTLNTANRMNNQINGISPNNARLKIYMEAGRGIVKYTGNQISNEWLNWTGK